MHVKTLGRLEEVDVPTDKQNLLGFLNVHAVGGNPMPDPIVMKNGHYTFSGGTQQAVQTVVSESTSSTIRCRCRAQLSRKLYQVPWAQSLQDLNQLGEVA